MHVEMDREICLWALDLVSKISTKHQTLPVLQCVLIRTENNKTTFISTNLELGIEVECDVEVKDQGVVAVPATLLFQTINLLTHKTVTLQTEHELLIVKSKSSDTKIKTITSNEFPTIPQLTTTPQKINGPLFCFRDKNSSFCCITINY